MCADEKDNLQSNICKQHYCSPLFVWGFFLMILLLNLKILKTQKSKMGALDSSKVPAGVIAKVLAEPKRHKEMEEKLSSGVKDRSRGV